MDWPDWSGETVVVVASGPSAANVPLKVGRDKVRFLAVKDAWKLCPWAELLYACDHHWWEAHRGVPGFEGRRIAYDQKTVEKWRGLGFLKVEIKKAWQQMLFDEVGHVGWGGNSGFHALNLALQFGAARVLLVGFDMRVDQGKHFFGPHPYAKERPSEGNCRKWREVLDREAPKIAARGVDVINCSAVSALTAYRKMDFQEAINVC